MTQSEIYYFAGKCLVLDENPEFRKKVLEVCLNDSIDWKQFVAICSNNLILPSIYLKFRSHNILEHLPHDLNEHLLEIYELNRQRNNRIVAQIKFITAVLNEQNIFPLFFKGAGNLIDDVYSDLGERLMYDIDFMVPEKDFLTSAEIMMNQGYLSYSEIDFLENLPNLKVLPKWMHHYPVLYHPDFPAFIEIHRMPTHNKSKWFNQGIINAEKKAASTLKGCFVPSFQHRIIHNFIHSQLSHKGYLLGNVPLRDINDLQLLSKQSSLIEILPKIKKRKTAIAYFAFARNVFGFDDQFFHKQNWKYRTLKKKHELMMDSRLFKKFFLSLISIIHFIQGYTVRFFQAFYSKEIRRAIIKNNRNRLKSMIKK